MYPISKVKKAGAHFAALTWLAAAAVACQDPGAADVCNDRPECYKADATSDRSVRSDAATSDAQDSGQARNPLCGNMGCFPGNLWTSCGSPQPALPPSAWMTASPQDDAASDASGDTDVIVVADASGDVATPDARSDARSDAKSDGCHDDASDGGGPSPDVTADAGPTVDASTPDTPPMDDGSTPPDVATDGGFPPADASIPPDARADVRLDLGTEEPPILQSCYINPGARGGVVTECAPVGLLAVGSACNDSHECGAGMACVEADQKATCRLVSCGFAPDCQAKTFYRELSLRANGVTRNDLPIPVCYPTDNCVLLAPDQCPAGKACAVVGTTGDTTCLEPGLAMAGESCSDNTHCAEGLLCSRLARQCVKICRADPDARDCPNGICQAGNLSLPSGFGICVGQVDGG